MREECREVSGLAFGESFFKDIRFGVRMLMKNPGFSLVSILTLGLGIGATTAIFSAVYALLIRPLPYPDSDRLVVISEAYPKRAEYHDALISPDFVAAQSGLNSFAMERAEP